MTSGPETNTASQTKPVLVLGAGGHARVLISLLRLLGREISAILDDEPSMHGKPVGHTDTTVHGSFDQIKDYASDQIELVNAVGSAKRPTARQTIHETYTNAGYTFATILHPDAILAPETTIQPGAQIMAGAIIQPQTNIEANCLINTGASIDHDTTIGKHSHIAPGATVCGDVTIGEGCHIGAGATVIQGITIGDGAVIGAGATVLNRVADQQVVVGTPAKPQSK